jgi:outer membrane protein assembly factor BamB
MVRLGALLIALLFVLGGNLSLAQEQGIADFPKLNVETDWPWWRGPSRNGVASHAPVPTKFSDGENMVWKAKVPGRGHSSPIVVGDRIYLSTAFQEGERHCVLAFDRQTGQEVWQVEVNQGAFPAKNHRKNTEATPTIACDGERLFVTFYHHDQVELITLGFDGQVLWRKKVADFHPKLYEYGYAPSPVIYRGSVIVASEYEGGSFISALDRVSGKKLWQSKRLPSTSFSTPVIGHVAGKDQMLMSGQQFVTSYNPATGKANWLVQGTTHATCGTMVWEGDIVFASGGFPKSETIAVRADGSRKVLWTNNQKCYEQSMIVHEGHLYALTDNGVMFCWHGESGEEKWKHRLSGPVSASPVLAGGNIYWSNEAGTMYVFKPTPEKFDLVAENKIGSSAFASPAICGGQIFLRVGEGDGPDYQEWLYCFASGK